MTDVTARRDRRPRAAGPAAGAEGLELVRLGQLGLLHDGRSRVLFAPYMITVAGTRRRLRRTPTRPAPRPSACSGCTSPPGSLPFYLDQLRDHRQRVRAAGRRRLRRPLGRKKWHMAGVRLGRVVLRRAAVLHAGRQLAARRGRDRAEQHPRRLLAGQLLRDPRRHLHRGRARPGLLARLGAGATSAAACCCGQPGDVPRPRRARASTRAWPSGSRCCRRRCGGPASRSSRCCGCATTRRTTSSPEPGGLLQRSFGQLFTTLREMRSYPMTLTFLLALPLLQRRHPDRDRRRVDVRLQAARLRRSRC